MQFITVFTLLASSVIAEHDEEITTTQYLLRYVNVTKTISQESAPAATNGTGSIPGNTSSTNSTTSSSSSTASGTPNTANMLGSVGLAAAGVAVAAVLL